MAADNLSDNNSVTAPIVNYSRHSGQSTSSPKSRRSVRTVSSPWSQVVRGELEMIDAVPLSPSNMTPSVAVVEPVSSSSCSSSSHPIAEEPVGESSDSGNGSCANAGKKPVWNKLSNGTAEVGTFMGAESWPALSESTRATAKTSSESLKGLADGSASTACQATGNVPSSSQKEVGNDASPSSDSTHTHSTTSRQKSMRRNGANNSYNNGLPQQSAISSSVIDAAPNNSKDQTQKTASASQPHNNHGYHQQRNSFRSRSGGSHPRGDSSHQHNHNARRDQDRGNQDRNSHRTFGGQPQRVVQRFIRPPPPPGTATFIPPPPMRPLGGPIPFPDFVPPMVYVAAPPPPSPPEALRGVSFVPPIPPNAMFFPAPDPQLHAKIVQQIDYYFSAENLIRDTFLRRNMDEYGWVPIKLIAGFNKVQYLTNNLQLILDALQSSAIVEVQGDKVRRRNDWSRWLMPPSAQSPNNAGPLSPGRSSHDMLAAGVQGIAVEKVINYGSTEGQDQVEAPQSRPYGNLTIQTLPYGDDGTGQPDHSSSERS